MYLIINWTNVILEAPKYKIGQNNKNYNQNEIKLRIETYSCKTIRITRNKAKITMCLNQKHKWT